MTLAARVAHLVQQGLAPQRLLLLTFSRRAAEMERRAGLLLQRALGLARPPALPWAGTFHSVGARLLREHRPGGRPARGLTVHDRTDAEDLMGWVRHEQGSRRGIGSSRTRAPLAIYSRVVNAQSTLAEVLQRDFPWCSVA